MQFKSVQFKSVQFKSVQFKSVQFKSVQPKIVPLKIRLFAFLVFPVALAAQQRSDVDRILERLDRLEQENRDLAAEVHALRSELAAAAHSDTAATGASASAQIPPEGPAASSSVPAAPTAQPLEEQVAVQQQRVADLAQTKVQASQRLPISLTGMVLFNSFANGSLSGGQEYPTVAASSSGHASDGATLSQSVVGLNYQGPQILGGAQVNASLLMDLWGGTPSSSLDHLLRMRIATISLDWKSSSLTFGQDKPIVSPREPDSLAQVAFSPLANAGNLWLWQPQLRFEQRFQFGDAMGLRAQAGVYETSEPVSSAGNEYASTLSSSRPAAQGRFEFWRSFGTAGRIEIAPGFHTSETHVANVSVPSRLFTIDWLIQPISRVKITGMFFQGENTAGLGGLRQGFTVFGGGDVRVVHAAGGWSQVTFQVTPRLAFHAYAGQESDQAADLLTGLISRNFLYAGNAIYRLGSNVLLGFETSQVRTTYVGIQNRVNDHYDLSLAYLF